LKITVYKLYLRTWKRLTPVGLRKESNRLHWASPWRSRWSTAAARSPPSFAEVAIGKAYTAATFARPSAEVSAVFDGRIRFTASISVATGGR
jgi:hypothetical protein